MRCVHDGPGFYARRRRDSRMLRGCGAPVGAGQLRRNQSDDSTQPDSWNDRGPRRRPRLATAQDRKPLSPAGHGERDGRRTRGARPTRTATASTTGGKWLEVTYSRPMLRGRTDIFGKGADYGKVVNGGAPVWRAGANATTKFKTEVPLMIGGKRVEPGSYDVFVELKEPRVDAHPLDAADAGQVRPERQDEDLGRLRLRPQVRRRARPDDDAHSPRPRSTSSRSASST